jgi:hypothetical protein
MGLKLDDSVKKLAQLRGKYFDHANKEFTHYQDRKPTVTQSYNRIAQDKGTLTTYAGANIIQAIDVRSRLIRADRRGSKPTFDAKYLNVFDRLFQSDTQRQDALVSPFALEQLTFIEAMVLEDKYPGVIYRDLQPLVIGGGPGAMQSGYYRQTQTGTPKFNATVAKDIPHINTQKARVTTPHYQMTGIVSHSRQDLLASQFAGESLDATDMRAANQAFELKTEQAHWLGTLDKSNPTPGWLDQLDGFDEIVLAADGTGAVKDFDAKTGEQVLRDCNQLLRGIHTSTNTVFRADTLMLSPIDFAVITMNPRSATTDTTVGDFLLAHNPFLQRIVETPYLSLDNNTLGENISIAGETGMGNVEFMMPEDLSIIPIGWDGLEYCQVFVRQLAGLRLKRPTAFVYGYTSGT